MAENSTKQDPEVYICVAEQQVTTVKVAKCPKGSTLKNVKTIPRKLRIQVLDCRSGQPVPNVTIEDFSFYGDPAWDIAINYIIPVNTDGPSAGQPLNPRGFTPSNRRELQRLLKALGFLNGKESTTFDNNGWAALKEYQHRWYLAHDMDPSNYTFEKKVTDDWQKRIIEEYNQCFIRTVQFHLTLLGFPCLEDDGEWGDASQKAFVNWQQVELGSKKPFTTFNNTAQLYQRRTLAKRIQGAKKPFVSDVDGIITFPVTAERARKGFKMKLSFRDFAFCEEKGVLEREKPVIANTGFSVVWKPGNEGQDTQGKRSGTWGWRLRPRGNTEQDATMLPEFKTFTQIEIPPCPDLDWRRLHQEKNIFSKFYQGHLGNSPELVVWALVWCQPVWDGVEDPPNPDLINQKVFVQNTAERNFNMHLVTRYADGAGSDLYGGKGYGKLEYVASPLWRGKNHPADALGGHRGHDVYALIGDPVFAVHGGDVKHKKLDTVQGNVIYLTWKAPAGVHSRVEFLHLNAFESESLKYAKAGALIGRAGRTGNLGQTSERPTHCHLNVGASGYNSMLRQGIPDNVNNICIPHNDIPLMFPCACQVTHADMDPSGCDFSITKFVNSCWAVAELKCPSMDETNKENRRIQAQLRYLFDRGGSGTANPYLHPGTLDGSIGTSPIKRGDFVSKTRLAIRAFRIANNMSASYELDNEARALLNKLAPVTLTRTVE